MRETADVMGIHRGAAFLSSTPRLYPNSNTAPCPVVTSNPGGRWRSGTRVLPSTLRVHSVEYCFPTPVAAKLAIAADLATPLAKLSDEDKAFIDQVLTDTLIRGEVFARVRGIISATPNQERIMRVEN